MNIVREWSAVLCMAALAAALIQYLLPCGAMEKVVRLVVGAFVICSVLLPLQKTLPRLSLELQGNSDQAVETGSELSNTVDAQLQSAAQSGISSLVIKELMEMNVKYENVAVMMDTNESGSISISKVVVSLDPSAAARSTEVQTWLEEKLGLKTEVISNDGT